MIARTLAALGRRGTGVIAGGVFVGLLVPGLSRFFEPLLVPSILLPFLVALLRIDLRRLRLLLGAPLSGLALLAWLLLGSPLLVRLALLPFDLPAELAARLVTNAACAPLMASAALALLLGLDVTLALVATVAATFLVPFTLPTVALHVAGIGVTLDAASLSLRLALLIGGPAVLAVLLRARWGDAVFAARASELDGLAVLALVAFSVAVMGSVRGLLAAAPAQLLVTLAAVFALNIGLQIAGTLLAAPAGLRTALTVGLLSGNNNIGIVLAAMADRAPDGLVAYVALAQFPIYLLPLAQRHLYRPLLGRGATAPVPGLPGERRRDQAR